MLARSELEPDHQSDPGPTNPAALLWSEYLKFDAADPHWPDRDRCVISAAAPCLDGTRRHGLELQASTVPAGQGLAMAVGMALAERMLAARFGKSLVDHRTWCIVTADDLMEGISQEAGSLAGHFRLAKLTVLYQAAEGAGAGDEVIKRFASCGWAVQQADLRHPAELASALSFAIRCKKPTLIACNPAPESAEAGAGENTLRWEEVGSRGAGARRAWLKRSAHHPQRAEFDRMMAGRLPEAWHEAVASLKAGLADARPRLATERASQIALEALASAIGELVGGATYTTMLRGMASVTQGQYGGRHVSFGSRGYGMAAAMNGMSLHGGVIPFGRTDLAGTDTMRPALRLAALMRLRVIHLANGADGEAEQLAGLRSIPNLHVFRPADGIETAECLELALRRAEGPSMIVLGSQKLPALRSDPTENCCARGGYVLADAEGPRRATLIAGGAEVAIAIAARTMLAFEGIGVAVVSLPCWELFYQQDLAYRSRVLGSAARIGIEAADGFGWERWLGEGGCFVGRDGFAATDQPEKLYRHLGLTADALVNAVKRRIDQ
jgi:transketolase